MLLPRGSSSFVRTTVTEESGDLLVFCLETAVPAAFSGG
jgi:hypothetical protein